MFPHHPPNHITQTVQILLTVSTRHLQILSSHLVFLQFPWLQFSLSVPWMVTIPNDLLACYFDWSDPFSTMATRVVFENYKCYATTHLCEVK